MNETDLRQSNRLPTTTRTGRVWRPRNAWTTRRGIAVVLGLALLGQAGHAGGQPANPTGTPAPTEAAQLEAPLLDGSHGQTAHDLAERWVRAGAVGEPDAVPEQRVTDLFAVRVTLRQQGFTVATGDAFRADPQAAIDTPGPAVGLVELTRQATAAALDNLRTGLRDARARAQNDPQLQQAQEQQGGPRDIRLPALEDVGRSLLVGVQLARHPVTVRLPANPDPGGALGAFAPGYHGLRLVGQRGAGAVVWPATSLAQNVSPKSQLIQLLADEGHTVLDLPKVGVPGGPVLQRFEVLHVVRPGAGQPPMELVRGGVVLPPLALNMRTLQDLADRLAGHLETRFTDDGQVRGTFHPTRGAYDPVIAGDEDTAWACYAVARYAKHLRAVRPGGRGEEFGRLALRQVTRLAERAADGRPLEPAAAALLLLTITDDGLPDPEGARLRDALGRVLVPLVEQAASRQTRDALQLAAGGVAGTPPAEEPQAPPTLNSATQALTTAALAAWFDQTRDPQVGAVVQASLDGLWNASNGRLSTGVMPWYASALTRVGPRLAGEDADAKARLAQRQATLAELVDTLAQQQVIERPVLGPMDVIGGFELVAGPPGSPPSPNWYTGHLLHFVGLAIADDAVGAKGDRFGWVITGGLAARFIGQLMMDDPSCFYVGDRHSALRGVRLALWDNTLPVFSTAISLLGVTQLQEAAEAVLPTAIDMGPGILDVPPVEEGAQE